MLTKAEFTELMERATVDPQPFIESLFEIDTLLLPGELPIQKLKFNGTQIRVHEAVMRMRRAGLPPRIIVLKARRPGVSTLACGYIAATAMTRPFSGSMQVAQDEMATLGLFRKVKLMFERMPAEIRPIFLSDRRDELIIQGVRCHDGVAELRSTVSMATAGGEEPWRSKTLQTVHLSEFSAMNRAADVLLGILNAVTRSPESLVIVESTARGVGNAFHAEWQSAVAGESGFTPVFVPWFELPQNQMRRPDDFVLDPDEREIMRRHQLTVEQMVWRRYVIYTECQKSVDRFNQENPPTAEEAFILTGESAFDVQTIRRMMNDARHARPPEVGVYTLDGGFSAYARGPLKVYERPVAGHEYTIGADPSAGTPGGDPCCAQVFNRTTGQQVATWHGHATPTVFAHITNALGRWYNNAILAPELNGGWGNTMIEELKGPLQYPTLYQFIQPPDRFRRTMSNYLGWYTTFRTKQYLIDTTAHALIEGDLVIRDLLTLQEFEHFQYFDGLRAAGSEEHDDACMSMLIAYRVHVEMPMRATGLPPRLRYEDPKPREDEVPMPAGEMNRDAWTDADAILGKSRQIQRLQDEIFQPDDDDMGRGELPDGIDHPW